MCSEFEAKLQVLELPEHKPIMSQGYTCVLHLHTSVEEVEITTVVSLFDNEKGKYVKSSFLKSGVTGQARILVIICNLKCLLITNFKLVQIIFMLGKI